MRIRTKIKTYLLRCRPCLATARLHSLPLRASMILRNNSANLNAREYNSRHCRLEVWVVLVIQGKS